MADTFWQGDAPKASARRGRHGRRHLSVRVYCALPEAAVAAARAAAKEVCRFVRGGASVPEAAAAAGFGGDGSFVVVERPPLPPRLCAPI